MNVKFALAGVIVAALSAPVLAQSTGTTSTPRIDKRQAEQEKRIQQGVESGQLTGKEANRLEKGQAHVQTMENKAMADGAMTKKERAHIEHAQNVQSKKIYRQKHDKQTAN
jgi:hypothetical protein